MNALHRNLIAGIAAAGWFAGAGSAQTIVNGTGNPDIDIAAVQAAVDMGGRVMLRGSFSFNSPPAMRGTLPGLMATILVSKGVTISGTWDEHGQMTTIDGGDIPIAVEAAGAAVKIERLRFNRPQLFAIFVDRGAIDASRQFLGSEFGDWDLRFHGVGITHAHNAGNRRQYFGQAVDPR
jgi:hypothetical protein